MNLVEIVLGAIVLLAAGALTLAVISLIRIPDSYVKVHAMSKAVILGPLLILAATLLTGDLSLILRAAIVGAFLVVTTPVGAHAIARLLWRAEADGTEEKREKG